MAFTKKTEEVAEQHEVQSEPLPHKFILLKGSNRSFKIEEEHTEILEGHKRYTIPAIVIEGRPLPGFPGVRIIDLEQHPAVTRVGDPRTPDYLAHLLMQNKRWTCDPPLIITLEEWKDMREREAELKRQEEEAKKIYTRGVMAKHGKLGAALPA